MVVSAANNARFPVGAIAKVANRGSSACQHEFSEDGTLIGLYLLIAGIILVVFTLVGVFLQKHCGVGVSHEHEC